MTNEQILHEAETLFAQLLQQVQDETLRRSLTSTAMIISECQYKKGKAHGLNALRDVGNYQPVFPYPNTYPGAFGEALTQEERELLQTVKP